MKRVRLNHEYHDATLVTVRFSTTDVTLVAELDGHWNNKVPETAYLTFHNVKNLEEIRHLFSASTSADSIETNDEIIAVVKLGKTTYLVDLQHTGALEIDCRGISDI